MNPAQAIAYPWHQKLPHLGTEEEFAALRALLEACSYSYDGICRRVNVDDLSKYESAPASELIGQHLEQPVDALIRLFWDCVFVREDELARLLPAGALRTLEAFDLLARDPDWPGLVFATAAILAAGRDLTVCDRGSAPDGTRCSLPPDVVYPAIFENTREFVDRLPQTPCDALLDIGTGTGIAAMRGARHATHVWASDISARCTLFAEFNRRLSRPGKHDRGGRRYVRSTRRPDLRPHRDAPALRPGPARTRWSFAMAGRTANRSSGAWWRACRVSCGPAERSMRC